MGIDKANKSDSVRTLGRPVRVKVGVDGHDFEAAPIPFGNGTIVSLKAGIRSLLSKQEGNVVEAGIKEWIRIYL